MISVNVVGHIRMIETFLPLMRRSRGRKDGGRIVNVTSTLARTFLPMAAPYCLTKSAMNAFSSCLRRELATFNIDVVTVEPGGVFSLSLCVSFLFQLQFSSWTRQTGSAIEHVCDGHLNTLTKLTVSTVSTIFHRVLTSKCADMEIFLVNLCQSCHQVSRQCRPTR